MDKPSSVFAWTQDLTIPTYPAQAPDPNPMFFEKRVNQGSSGRIYPIPFTEQLSSQKVDQVYRAVFLENEYIQLIMLPELGGRIFAGLDKVNHYDFFYRHRVIKPALIGLFGPWISGGVEFNWPQHHRPSTFMPVDYAIEEHEDGSKTVWLSEHEPMNRTKGMVGICLYPRKGYVETKVRIYNRTPFVQTFLWWENVAVHINEQYQVFFPPDVHSVVFHARAYTATFPIVKGFYAFEDFGEGTDVRYYKNIRLPTSFFASESQYDFFGGYDHLHQAGVVHVANRYISPGKKFFTWANGPFGHRWQQNLADDEGPYLELMAGVYTDNQPDFSWLQPYETKTFSQFWYPISKIGPVQFANSQSAVHLEVQDHKARIGICVTEDFPGANLILRMGDQVIASLPCNLEVGKAFQAEVELHAEIQETDLEIRLNRQDVLEVFKYTPEKNVEKPLPEPATVPSAPQDTPSNEDLYLIGLHLEQYRHATVSPEPYWREALRRDEGDARNNLMLGRLLLRRGDFASAEGYLRKAIQRLTRWNFNPYDGEAYYLLGLTLRYQGRLEEAYAALYKATWNYAWQSSGYYALAEIDCRRGNFTTALEHLDLSLQTNQEHLKARDLKAAILRRLGQIESAASLLEDTFQLDCLDLWALNEMVWVKKALGEVQEAARYKQKIQALVGEDIQTILDIAFDYSAAGLFDEAAEWLVRLSVSSDHHRYPMVYYTLGIIHHQKGENKKAKDFFQKASQMPPDYCFPFRLEEMSILQEALKDDPKDGRAAYYLGNLLYDKERHAEAIQLWETASLLEPSFAIPWRNLGLAAYNHGRDLQKSIAYYRKALEANSLDPRLLFELDQMMKRARISPAERLSFLEAHPELIDERDDLILELATLYNRCGRPEEALEVLLNRPLHPWEGGEGLVSGQFIFSHWVIGREALEAGNAAEAARHFASALELPDLLGEARYMSTDTLLSYYLGLAHDALHQPEKAREFYLKAVDAVCIDPSEYYFKAQAQVRLNEDAAAQASINALRDETRKMLAADPSAFFYPHMPSALFIDDLDEIKRIESRYLMGLAHLALGQSDEAKAAFHEVLEKDPSHQRAWEEYRRLSL